MTEPIISRVQQIVADGADCPTMMAAFAGVPDRINYDNVDASRAEVGTAHNLARARRVATVIDAYARDCGLHADEVVTAFQDFLNDARHLADALGVDWDEVSRPYHYDDEIRGPF